MKTKKKRIAQIGTALLFCVTALFMQNGTSFAVTAPESDGNDVVNEISSLRICIGGKCIGGGRCTLDLWLVGGSLTCDID